MIFKLHYWFLTSGACAIGILMGVFIETYTDASSLEIGALYMLMPFLNLITRPIICSIADRHQSHQKMIIWCLFITSLSYAPFVFIPLLGEQVYSKHGRLCWYGLVLFKIVGDIAFGGVICIGDALAINYANKIGTSFSVYRIWGTFSWMFFGLIIGHINEIQYLPKYVPDFLVLIISSLSDMLVIYLWPKEYFEMVSVDHDKSKLAEGGDKAAEVKKSCESAITKCLMPREVVWAHAKGKLWDLITPRCFTSNQDKEHKMNAIAAEVTTGELNNKNLPSTIVTISASEKNLQDSGNDSSNEVKKKVTQDNIRMDDETLEKKTQLKILLLLIRRDPRIVLYLLFFIGAGMSMIPINFFFISLSQICHKQEIDFSRLGGFVQISMASLETLLFVFIQPIKKFTGRLNLGGIAFLMLTIKFLFYGTIWTSVSPYYSVLAEGMHGVIFGIFLTLMVELGHLFANEVEFILPELIETGVVKQDSNSEKLKISLAATMQSLISGANDGLGEGFGALIYGLILEKYTYERLWFIIGVGASIISLTIFSISVFDKAFNPQLGSDVAAKRIQDKKEEEERRDGKQHEKFDQKPPSELGICESEIDSKSQIAIEA